MVYFFTPKLLVMIEFLMNELEKKWLSLSNLSQSKVIDMLIINNEIPATQ